MATASKFASSNTAVTSTYANPTNAYADDTNYATVSPGKGTNTVVHDFGFANFSTSDVPDGVIINSVTVSARAWGANAAVTHQIQPRVSGANNGTPASTTATGEATITGTFSGVTIANLRSASTVLAARMNLSRTGNTAYQANLDWVSITVDFTENHNSGTNALTGGGVIAEVGAKQGAWSGALTGGGIIADVGAKQALGATPATGGGVLTWAYEVVSGESHSGSFAGTGAGVLTATTKTDRPGVLTSTGGGVVAPTEQSGRLSSLTATGGGVVVVTLREGAPRWFSATGGGVAAIAGATARSFSLTATGAGDLAWAETGAHRVALAATGGGSLTFSGTRFEAHAGAFATTGNGVLTWAAIAAPFVPTPDKPVWVLAGAVPLPFRFIRRRGSFRATGGGRFIVTGRADWQDDELVLSLIA